MSKAPRGPILAAQGPCMHGLSDCSELNKQVLRQGSGLSFFVKVLLQGILSTVLQAHLPSLSGFFCALAAIASAVLAIRAAKVCA